MKLSFILTDYFTKSKNEFQVVAMPYPESANSQAIELIERFAQCILQESRTKDDISALKLLAPYITYFSNSTKLSTKQDDIFKNFLNLVDSSTEKLDPNEIKKEFNEEIEKAKDYLKDSKNCAKYKEFVKMIEVNLGNPEGNDEEIETVSESVNTIDPITKLPIVEPVKNKKCGHSYEKTSILQLIANNSRTRCPIPGCSAANFVKKGDLVPDNALKRLLAQTNAMQKKTTSNIN